MSQDKLFQLVHFTKLFQAEVDIETPAGFYQDEFKDKKSLLQNLKDLRDGKLTDKGMNKFRACEVNLVQHEDDEESIFDVIVTPEQLPTLVKLLEQAKIDFA